MEEYFNYIQQNGSLRSAEHAQRWSRATLQTLGLHLDRRTKKKLAAALPKELAADLSDKFWLAHFRDKKASSQTFQKEVARRSGNSDAQFARQPILAVFHQLKHEYADGSLRQQVADALAPQIRELWEQS